MTAQATQSILKRRRSLLSIAWIATLLLGEMGAFALHAALFCTWPDTPQPENGQSVLNVAVIADPQLTDFYSYRMPPGPVLSLVEFYSDVYMRRVFAALDWIKRPAKVIFVGDLFDGGRVIPSQQVFSEHLDRFHGIFGASTDPRFEFMAGNHDVGLGMYFSEIAKHRFEKHFAPLSHRFRLCDVDNVVVDSVQLATMLPFAEVVIPKPSQKQQQQQQKEDDAATIILWTHIPLWRPPGSPCGANRRGRPLLRQGHGVSYQNLLPEKVTKQLLARLRPAMVFSGDDHDNCKFEHRLPRSPKDIKEGTLGEASVRNGKRIERDLESNTGETMHSPEYTVGTFSWLQGTPYPSYALMSIVGKCSQAPDGHTLKGNNEEVPSPSVHVQVCFPPSQYTIYYSYIAMLIITAYVLAIEPVLQDMCSGTAFRHSVMRMDIGAETTNSSDRKPSEAVLQTSTSLLNRRKQQRDLRRDSDDAINETADVDLMDKQLKLRGGRIGLFLVGVKEFARTVRDVLALYAMILLIDWVYSRQ